MQLPEPLQPLIVILGPTAVGKTEISLSLAERLNGEIVSADSRLFYRGMDIGTAKPSPQERKRVPHHLINVADPDQTWSLAKFQREAHQKITSIGSRGSIPFLVGGTGQYLRAVTDGWVIPESRPDPELRQVLEAWAEEIDPLGLHHRLAVLDPEAAGVIDPRNLRRTVRALEVVLSTGKKFSEQRTREPCRYRLLQLGINRPRPELYQRIDLRIDSMISNGFVDEVKGLLDSGYAPDLPSFSAIGYQQIVKTLQGEIDLDEAVLLMKRFTRKYVRRQANWFKLNDPNIQWFQAAPDTIEEMETTIRIFFDS